MRMLVSYQYHSWRLWPVLHRSGRLVILEIGLGFEVRHRCLLANIGRTSGIRTLSSRRSKGIWGRLALAYLHAWRIVWGWWPLFYFQSVWVPFCCWNIEDFNEKVTKFCQSYYGQKIYLKEMLLGWERSKGVGSTAKIPSNRREAVLVFDMNYK